MSITKHEPTTDLVTTGSVGANLIREAAAVMVDAHKLAVAVAGTQMIPKHFQNKPDELAAAMLYGASLNLDPMQSARQIYVVHGQAALYARAMDALTKGAGHETWTVESTDESVTVAGRRRGSEHTEQATWSIDRAKRAGYTNNEKYRTDPQAMLYAKALSEVCRKIAPDVLNGVYSVEELQMERWDERPAAPSRGLGAALNITAEQVPTEAEAEPTGEPLLLNVRSALAKAMYAAINGAGVSEGQRIPYICDVIGREISSTKEMTEDEARDVLTAIDAGVTAGGTQ